MTEYRLKVIGASNMHSARDDYTINDNVELKLIGRISGVSTRDYSGKVVTTFIIEALELEE